MNITELHNNFIKILKFQYPNEPIKQWVLDDENRIGNYHQNWDELMPVVDKILKTEFTGGIIQDLQLALASVEIMRVYVKVVEFIDWYNRKRQYSFEKGDEYWIIVYEDGVKIPSKQTWNAVSEVLHDDDPNQTYYKSEYEAQMALPVDAIEISPILAQGKDNECTSYEEAIGFEVTSEDDPHIVAWGVYAHRKGVGATNLFDVVDKRNAEQAEAILKKLYKL